MDAPPPPPPADGLGVMPKPCGVHREPGKLIGYGAAPSVFARILAGILKRPVVDATDLKGRYDFDLQHAGDETSILTALQEQLGLKLAEERRQISVLVIDSAERA